MNTNMTVAIRKDILLVRYAKGYEAAKKSMNSAPVYMAVVWSATSVS